ncbi:glycosyltransferase [Sphingomonas mollis]|uniref:Glycosyltransferase n=1 Tax=Sphingomonas mollis TaxID=2795726 RepID=A0ABS0XTI2_9SPHN|nr:glycosyltransferase [Sphingomonas sp. BT553]MBJ6123332.1 glycosyltransferase [Sphingomonas sp. BT553]
MTGVSASIEGEFPQSMVAALPRSPRRVALVHYWLVNMRGGERVLEALGDLFPDADIYTHVVAPERLSDRLKRHRIQTTFISRLPRAIRWYQRYLPLMPLALEALDLSDYDLVICSEAGPSKGVILHPGATQIVYCHSPMRYIWDKYHFYRGRAGFLTRMLMPLVAHYLRIWDAASSLRVDAFVANSNFVAGRLRQAYRRDATVVYPPVDVDAFATTKPATVDDFYLWCGELVAYKRPDVAIDAFNTLGLPLVVIGGGEELNRLRQRAGPNITFLGKASFDVLRDHMAQCRALIFPGEEDFGMVPVEVQASGRPVVALARGGALETVLPGKTGILYQNDDTEGLTEAVRTFEASGLAETCSPACIANAARFGKQAFMAGMTRVLLDHGISIASPSSLRTA